MWVLVITIGLRYPPYTLEFTTEAECAYHKARLLSEMVNPRRTISCQWIPKN